MKYKNQFFKLIASFFILLIASCGTSQSEDKSNTPQTEFQRFATEKVTQLLVNDFNVKVKNITPESTLGKDLGVNEFFISTVLPVIFEHNYGIILPNENLNEQTTVGYLIDYMMANGTESGIKSSILANEKRKAERKAFEESFPHIEFGFRNEWINYKTAKEKLVFATYWAGGSAIIELSSWDKDLLIELSEQEKRKMFKELVDFINVLENVKPTISYISDAPNGELWKELCEEHKASISSVEVTTIKEEKQQHYQSLLESIKSEQTKEIHIDGYVLKTIEDLNKYWKERYSE